MAGLVGYVSSDEEDHAVLDISKRNVDLRTSYRLEHSDSTDTRCNGDAEPHLEAPLVGPILGPVADVSENLLEDTDQAMAPLSPYSANRALLRDLTLPTLPNYNIPPSPPGSPLASTNAKFKHFLGLKKQGVHFNEKLAKSDALKNPSLMQKLMDFADIDDAGQYLTTLPRDLWDPYGFPAHAFKEELAKSQQRILKRQEEDKAKGQRDSLDFVPATSTSEIPSRNGTLSNSGRPGQKSAAERIMAGLDINRPSSSQAQGSKRKSRFDI
ncbi:unnamed protein product [Diplocarpon coronariae]|nr:hypothetical protein JHW43_005077 [Diplocarpon mali]